MLKSPGCNSGLSHLLISVCVGGKLLLSIGGNAAHEDAPGAAITMQALQLSTMEWMPAVPAPTAVHPSGDQPVGLEALPLKHAATCALSGSNIKLLLFGCDPYIPLLSPSASHRADSFVIAGWQDLCFSPERLAIRTITCITRPSLPMRTCDWLSDSGAPLLQNTLLKCSAHKSLTMKTYDFVEL